MSFVESLHKACSDAVAKSDVSKELDEAGDKFIEDLLTKSRASLASSADTLGPEGVAAASRAIDILRENRTHFYRLSKVEFAYVLAHWGDKEEAEARRTFLATTATFKERRKAMHAAGDKVEALAKAREDAWNKTKEILQDIGTIGLSFLIKLAIAAIAV